MSLYHGLLVLKFLAVIGFGAGALATFLASEARARKLAAHRIASPCLLITWVLGYTLLTLSGRPLLELWSLASLVLSFCVSGVLAYAAARGTRGPAAMVGTALPIAIIVVLMVLKPT